MHKISYSEKRILLTGTPLSILHAVRFSVPIPAAFSALQTIYSGQPIGNRINNSPRTELYTGHSNPQITIIIHTGHVVHFYMQIIAAASSSHCMRRYDLLWLVCRRPSPFAFSPVDCIHNCILCARLNVRRCRWRQQR